MYGKWFAAKNMADILGIFYRTFQNQDLQDCQEKQN
jgi:hypothetical protein